jgi:hypothetical protein
MSDENEPVVKKKRGRKKKSELLALEALQQQEQVNGTQETSAEKPKSRRGRKTKAVVNAYDVEENVYTMSDDENIIVKLDIKKGSASKEMDENMISPNAYDAHQQSSFESLPLRLTLKETNMDVPSSSSDPIADIDDTKDLKVVDLLKDFKKKSNALEWPSNTSISCYWCCHTFQSVPYGIPVKYYNERFHVYGCFCSLECAAAFNFTSQESSNEIWERYNLINLLSRKLDYKPIVKPAPSRLSLKIFGGHLSIEEFREYFDSTKILSENFPPMMTMTQQIEEINECDINSEYRYIPIDQERINKYKEKLTLKRTKPLNNYKNTLDHMMNLKIHS